PPTMRPLSDHLSVQICKTVLLLRNREASNSTLRLRGGRFKSAIAKRSFRVAIAERSIQMRSPSRPNSSATAERSTTHKGHGLGEAELKTIIDDPIGERSAEKSLRRSRPMDT